MAMANAPCRARSTIDHALIALSMVYWVLTLICSHQIIRLDHIPDRIVILAGPCIVALLPAGFLLFLALLARRPGLVPSPLNRPNACAAGLALVVAVSLGLYPWRPVLTANLLYLAAPLPAAGVITALLYRKRACGRRPVVADWLLITVAASMLYAWLGYAFTLSVGEHSGDEGHYIAQAESLYYDGDLDLRNNFGDDPPPPDYVHISPNALKGKWYSWHTPGLSFLLAPTVGAGILWRHAVLGLIAGLGVAGLYALARAWGADRRSSALAAALLSLGPFWCIYASRALPEVLGATLAVYAMLAVFMQRRYPWSTLALSVPCVAFLPWTHTRFIPVAVTLIGCYGLQGLVGPETWPRKLLRLGLYTLLCLLSLGVYQGVQLMMFEQGLSYPVPDLLFSLPSGLWHTLASSRGILFMFPVFACALAASLFMAVKPGARMAGIYTLLVFLSVWLTACGTRWFTGGACMPGRFLTVVTPLFAACLAVALTRASGGFRLLTVYLGLFPAALFVVQLTVLKAFGKAFSDPLLLDATHPVFSGLVRLYYDPYRTTAIMPAGMLYAVTVFLLFRPAAGRLVQGLALTVLVAAYATAAYLPNRDAPASNPRQACRFLEKHDRNGLRVYAIGRPGLSRQPLTLAFNRFHGAGDGEVMSLTSRDLGTRVSEGWISVPHLAPNDWAKRGFRWATLVAPFRAGKGKRALRLQADNNGDADVEFVIREGAHHRALRLIPARSSFDETIAFTTEDTGDLYMLARFSGTGGAFEVRQIAYTPYTESLLNKAGLCLPDR